MSNLSETGQLGCVLGKIGSIIDSLVRTVPLNMLSLILAPTWEKRVM